MNIDSKSNLITAIMAVSLSGAALSLSIQSYLCFRKQAATPRKPELVSIQYQYKRDGEFFVSGTKTLVGSSKSKDEALIELADALRAWHGADSNSLVLIHPNN